MQDNLKAGQFKCRTMKSCALISLILQYKKIKKHIDKGINNAHTVLIE